MKTLLISLYDCTTNCSAAVIDESGSVTAIDLSRNLFHAVYDSNFTYKFADEDTKKALAKVVKLYDEYDHVILCEDGSIKQIK